MNEFWKEQTLESINRSSLKRVDIWTNKSRATLLLSPLKPRASFALDLKPSVFPTKWFLFVETSKTTKENHYSAEKRIFTYITNIAILI